MGAAPEMSFTYGGDAVSLFPAGWERRFSDITPLIRLNSWKPVVMTIDHKQFIYFKGPEFVEG